MYKQRIRWPSSGVPSLMMRSPGHQLFNYSFFIANASRWFFVLVCSTLVIPGVGADAIENAETKSFVGASQRSDVEMLNLVKRNTLQWIFDNTNAQTGLVSDRDTKPGVPSSIAAVGFAFYCYPIAVDSGLKTREEAAIWARKVLRVLVQSPDGEAKEGVGKCHGMFYHMLDPATGLRATKATGFWDGVEVSTIDTALLVDGALFARAYFDRNDKIETEIRQLATKLYEDVNWKEYELADGTICMDWKPEDGMGKSSYTAYCEDGALYIPALASPTHPISPDCWKRGVTSRYEIERLPGMTKKSVVMPAMPMFCYQYPQLMLPLKGIYDETNRALGMDYWEIAAQAAEANWQYLNDNPKGWVGYDQNADLLTACDGPGNFKMVTAAVPRKERQVNGAQHTDSQNNQGASTESVSLERVFRGYSERGIIHGLEPRIRDGFDDGTGSATATICMLPFPEQRARVLRVMRYQMKRPGMFGQYGFADSHNDTLNWIDPDHVAIDQGPIVIAIQEAEDGFVSKIMKKDPSVRLGLERAGFTGGWLSAH